MKIHFIGIGGIGLSGLARYSHKKNHKISGSDIANTKLIESLKKEGIEDYIPHTKEAIKNQDLIVYSAVVKNNNTENL